jgi:hypothetical protein
VKVHLSVPVLLPAAELSLSKGKRTVAEDLFLRCYDPFLQPCQGHDDLEDRPRGILTGEGPVLEGKVL